MAYKFVAPEQPPEDYEAEEPIHPALCPKCGSTDWHQYSRYSNICNECKHLWAVGDCWTEADQEKLDGVVPVGAVQPIDPTIEDMKILDDTYECCKQCGSPRWVRYNHHWACAECYTEYETNIRL